MNQGVLIVRDIDFVEHPEISRVMIVIQLMILKVIGKDSVLRFRLVLVISLQRQCLKTGFHKTQPLQQEGAPYLAKLVYKLVYWWFWYTYHK